MDNRIIAKCAAGMTLREGLSADGMLFPPGDEYYVDGTHGSDANDGSEWSKAWKTIQHAITYQIAHTSGLGDVIYVAPGNYAESLTGDLTRCSIIGVRGDYPWHIVSIRPTDGPAYTGTVFEACFRNLCMLSSSGENKDQPALWLTAARYSVIEDCHFVGRDTTCEEAIQIGPTDDTGVATATAMDFCIIRRNKIDTWYGYASEFEYGIKMGAVNWEAQALVSTMTGVTIEDNVISTKTYGMYFCTVEGSTHASVIRNNVVGSSNSVNGCATAGIAFYTSTGFTYVIENWSHGLSAFTNCTAARLLNNIGVDSTTITRQSAVG